MPAASMVPAKALRSERDRERTALDRQKGHPIHGLCLGPPGLPTGFGQKEDLACVYEEMEERRGQSRAGAGLSGRPAHWPGGGRRTAF